MKYYIINLLVLMLIGCGCLRITELLHVNQIFGAIPGFFIGFNWEKIKQLRQK